MITKLLKRDIFKTFFLISLLPFLFTSCIYNKQLPDGATDFAKMLETMVEESYGKITTYIDKNDVVLVPDFVNLDRLQNRSKLGFLLSDSLKNALSNKDVIVKAVEVGKVFKFGPTGFNILTRKQSEIETTTATERYAIAGTYSLTTKRLILFIKLIDIQEGTIVGSSTSSVMMDEEIIEMERTPLQRVSESPLTL